MIVATFEFKFGIHFPEVVPRMRICLFIIWSLGMNYLWKVFNLNMGASICITSLLELHMHYLALCTSSSISIKNSGRASSFTPSHDPVGNCLV